MILVTGSTGVVGGLTVDRLARAGLPVRVLTREAGAASLPHGVEVAQGDLSDAASLGPALDGVDTVFLIWKQVTARDPEAAIRAMGPRVLRIVYLSSLSVRDDLERQIHPMTATHALIERSIAAAVGSWTVLRAGIFMKNGLTWRDELRETGARRFPYPDAGRSPVHEEDLADAAAAVLGREDDGLDGRTMILSGPEEIPEADLVSRLGEAVGEPWRLEPVDPDAYRAELLAEGEDPAMVDGALAYWERLTRIPEPVTGDVTALTGRPGRTYDEWVREHADAFR
jgi:uncharacterized protein YbjT (DUF2867 family)